MLRTRLDAEFGANARGVCVGLLAPGLQREVAAATLVNTMFFGGIGIMGSKVLAGVVALVAVAAAAVWLWTGANADDAAPVAAGGRGVVVPAAVAMARVETTRVAAGPEQAEPEATSTPRAGSDLRVHGFVFVDDVHRAPSDLTIETSEDGGSLQWNAGAATWSFAVGSMLANTAGDARRRARASTLWITSPSTVPAQVPIPAASVAWRRCSRTRQLAPRRSAGSGSFGCDSRWAGCISLMSPASPREPATSMVDTSCLPSWPRPDQRWSHARSTASICSLSTGFDR